MAPTEEAAPGAFNDVPPAPPLVPLRLLEVPPTPPPPLILVAVDDALVVADGVAIEVGRLPPMGVAAVVVDGVAGVAATMYADGVAGVLGVGGTIMEEKGKPAPPGVALLPEGGNGVLILTSLDPPGVAIECALLMLLMFEEEDAVVAEAATLSTAGVETSTSILVVGDAPVAAAADVALALAWG